MLLASTASAVHYYGEIVNSSVPAGDADEGGYVVLNTSTLAASSCSEFINHEFWYGTVPGTSPTQWVEVGFKDGTSQMGCKTRTLFWGENNGTGYHFHGASNTWSLGTWYAVYIQETTNCQWYAYAGGIQLGKSLVNCPGTGRYLAAGIESTSQTSGNSADGFSENWKRETGASVWISDWDAPALSIPPSIQYTDGTHTVTEEWQ